MRIIGCLEEPTVHRLWNTLLLIVFLWIGLACRLDADDRMVRRYAGCMADAHTTLHRLNASGAVGTVLLRRGGGGAGACSIRAGGGHDGADQGQLRPLL